MTVVFLFVCLFVCFFFSMSRPIPHNVQNSLSEDSSSGHTKHMVFTRSVPTSRRGIDSWLYIPLGSTTCAASYCGDLPLLFVTSDRALDYNTFM